jgi:DNA-binding XRE family transcriptional regulator
MPTSKPTPVTPLKKVRVEADIPTETLARAVGVRSQTINRIENAKSKASLDLANRIAKYFGNVITRDQILYPEDYMSRKAS